MTNLEIAFSCAADAKWYWRTIFSSLLVIILCGFMTFSSVIDTRIWRISNIASLKAAEWSPELIGACQLWISANHWHFRIDQWPIETNWLGCSRRLRVFGFPDKAWLTGDADASEARFLSGILRRHLETQKQDAVGLLIHRICNLLGYIFAVSPSKAVGFFCICGLTLIAS